MAEIATEKNLTPIQRKAIEALLTSGSVADAAQTAGVARQTIYRWMGDQAFDKALREAESAAIQGLSRNLVSLGDSAAAALRAALADSQKIHTRLRASEIVIGNLLRLRELIDMEERLAALEEKYARSTETLE